MTAQPTWSDSDQGDLLELVAMGSPSTGSADREWESFVDALRWVARFRDADNDMPRGHIDPNRMRPLCRDLIAPRRTSAFYSRAVARDLIAPTGDWVISDDTTGRNSGRPCRVYRWIGGEL